MQNPIITLVWCCGNFQLLAPFISLTVDTKLFCVSPLHTKPTLVCFLVFTTLAYVAILTRLGSFNPLNFFNFSQWFRLQFAGTCLGGVVFYTVYITLFRRCMVWRERRRLSPSWTFDDMNVHCDDQSFESKLLLCWLANVFDIHGVILFGTGHVCYCVITLIRVLLCESWTLDLWDGGGDLCSQIECCYLKSWTVLAGRWLHSCDTYMLYIVGCSIGILWQHARCLLRDSF